MHHLGGHGNITHIDEGALQWLKTRGVQSLLDVGCSIGKQVLTANAIGMEAWGIEGDYQLLQKDLVVVPQRIWFADLTKGHVSFPVQVDAVWCVEVAEHIEERHLSNLFRTFGDNLKPGGCLVFTASTGPGIHHVTLKPMEWWKERLLAHGLKEDSLLTKELRHVSTMGRDFIRRDGVLLVKGHL